MPDAAPHQQHRSQHRRDAHDWATLFILTFTLIAAGCAAGFTGWQAWIARDQEHRALRAYVVVKTELATGRDGKTPYVKVTAENMGQTPVYDLFFAAEAFIEGGDEIVTYLKIRPIDCRTDDARQRESSDGRTFSRESSTGTSIMSFTREIKDMDEAFKNSGKLISYGRVCYRDIFRDLHSVRLCYEWTAPNYDPDKCRDENDGIKTTSTLIAHAPVWTD